LRVESREVVKRSRQDALSANGTDRNLDLDLDLDLNLECARVSLEEGDEMT
jgi:hypothetical protein